MVDIARPHGRPGGRFERGRVADLPVIFDDAATATQTLWSLFDGRFTEEFPGVKVFAPQAHDPGQFHTVPAPVNMPKDLAGLGLRFLTEPANKVEARGGTPVVLPPGAAQVNADQSVMDGAVFTWHTTAFVKRAAVMRHHLETRACIDQPSGEALVADFGDWRDAGSVAGHAEGLGEDHTIVALRDEDRQVWIDALAPKTDGLIADREARGTDDAIKTTCPAAN